MVVISVVSVTEEVSRSLYVIMVELEARAVDTGVTVNTGSWRGGATVEGLESRIWFVNLLKGNKLIELGTWSFLGFVRGVLILLVTAGIEDELCK